MKTYVLIMFIVTNSGTSTVVIDDIATMEHCKNKGAEIAHTMNPDMAFGIRHECFEVIKHGTTTTIDAEQAAPTDRPGGRKAPVDQ